MSIVKIMLSCMQEANIPLDQQQLDWLLRKFDKNCTATIMYRSVCDGVSRNSLYLIFTMQHSFIVKKK